MSAQDHGLAVVVAAFAGGPEWLFADEIRGRLRLLFGVELSSQAVVGMLNRMAVEDAPRFVKRRSPWGREHQYVATRYAQTDLENKLPNLRVRSRSPHPHRAASG